jgi:hypothetical protein
VGDTLVPLIIKSDGTHLTKYVGEKQKGPVYMTIHNQGGKIHHMPSMPRVVMVALLQIPMKNCNILRKHLDE